MAFDETEGFRGTSGPGSRFPDGLRLAHSGAKVIAGSVQSQSRLHRRKKSNPGLTSVEEGVCRMRQTCPLCGATKIARGSRGSKDVCEACSRALTRLSAYLESLDYPVALIAADHTILYSNGPLQSSVSRDVSQVVGLKIGEVLDCKNVSAHGSCGETPFCLHCDLRRSIELSRITGERLQGIPATIQKSSGGSTTCTVSAEKAGEAILLTLRMKTRRVRHRPFQFD